MTNKNPRRSVWSFVTPMGAIRRATDSVAKTREVLIQAKQSMVDNLPGQNPDGKYEEGDIRNIKDSKLRFQAMYDEHAWTPEEVDKQKRVCHVTKLVAFVMAIASVVGVVTLVLKSSLLMTLVLTPVACVSLLLGVAQGFKYALFEAQLDLKEFISAREFVSRVDFFRRLIG